MDGLRAVILNPSVASLLVPQPSKVTVPPVNPKWAMPAITLHVTVGTHLESHDGPSNLAVVNMQVNCWSQSYDQAFALRLSVIDILSQAKGTVYGTDLTLDGINEFRETELYDTTVELHQLILRCVCWWTRNL